MSFKGMLNKTGKIEEVTKTQDAITGEQEETWAVKYSGVKCRRDQNTGREFSAPNSIMERASHIIFLDNKYKLDVKKHRFVIGIDTYNILSVQDGGGQGHHLELAVELIQ